MNIYRAGHRPPSPGVLAVDHQHLYCLLTIHDLLQRRGVAAAFDLLTTAEIADALDACAFFDLHDLAAAVADIPLAASSPVSARVFDAEYRRRYTNTDRIVTAIRERVATRPFDLSAETT